MLSKKKIEELLKSHTITISYSFLEVDGKITTLPEELFVDPSDNDSLAYKAFCKNFKADRLTITMGAIAMSHSIAKHKNRKNFAGKDYYFDLRETNNEIEVFPGETISVCSNERIGIKDEYAAYILPRLTLADAGLFYVPSYIDPTWDGVMQAVIHNLSTNNIKLSIGEGISICRFYKIEGEIDTAFKKEFRVKNHHFGQNWEGILEESREPIRRGKYPVSQKSTFQQLLNVGPQLFDLFKKNYLSLFSGSIILAFAWGYQAINTITKDIPLLKDSVNNLNYSINKIPESNKLKINVPPNKIQYIHKETIKRPHQFIGTIWVDYKQDENIKNISVSTKRIDEHTSELTFIISLNRKLENNFLISLQYMLVY